MFIVRGKMTAIIARGAGRRRRVAQTEARVSGNASSIPDVPGMVFVRGSYRWDDKGMTKGPRDYDGAPRLSSAASVWACSQLSE